MDKLEISFGTPLRIILARDELEPVSHLTIIDGSTRYSARGNVMYTMPVSHAVELEVAYVDAGGNPAEVDGPVAWSTSDASIVQVQVDADNTARCVMSSGGKAGQAQVTATADADLGAGTRNLVTLLAVTVVAGEAVAGTIAPAGDAVPVGPEPVKAG